MEEEKDFDLLMLVFNILKIIFWTIIFIHI